MLRRQFNDSWSGTTPWHRAVRLLMLVMALLRQDRPLGVGRLGQIARWLSHCRKSTATLSSLLCESWKTVNAAPAGFSFAFTSSFYLFLFFFSLYRRKRGRIIVLALRRPRTVVGSIGFSPEGQKHEVVTTALLYRVMLEIHLSEDRRYRVISRRGFSAPYKSSICLKASIEAVGLPAYNFAVAPTRLAHRPTAKHVPASSAQSQKPVCRRQSWLSESKRLSRPIVPRR